MRPATHQHEGCIFLARFSASGVHWPKLAKKNECMQACTRIYFLRTDGVLCSPDPLWTQSREVMTFSQPVILFLAIWSPILHRFALWVCVNAHQLSSLWTVFQLCLLCCYEVSGWVVSYSPLDSVYQMFLSGLPLLSFMLYFIHLKLQLLTTGQKQNNNL